MAEEVVLKIIGGNLKGEEFVFDEKGLCLIGRSADCALQIPKEKDMKISRRHCLLILDPPNVRIRDLGSRNGTYVNNEMLQPGVISSIPEDLTPVDRVLKHGDKIEIGECILLIDIPTQQKSPGFVVPQIKPHLNTSHNKPISDPITDNDTPTLPANRPVTVDNIPVSPTVTNSSKNIAVTEVMSREEIRGVAKLSKTYVHGNNTNESSDEHVVLSVQNSNSQHQEPLVANVNPQNPVVHLNTPQVAQQANAQNLSPHPVPVIRQPGVLKPKSATPPVPTIKKPGRKTGAFAPLDRVDPGPLSPPPPKKTPTIVLSKKKNSTTTIESAPKHILKAKIVNKPSSQESLNAETTIESSPLPPIDESDSFSEKAPTDRISMNDEKSPTDKISMPVDKYQDTIVMDPTEMDGIPDLVSSTIPDVENTKRVAKFKIKGLK